MTLLGEETIGLVELRMVISSLSLEVKVKESLMLHTCINILSPPNDIRSVLHCSSNPIQRLRKFDTSGIKQFIRLSVIYVFDSRPDKKHE